MPLSLTTKEEISILQHGLAELTIQSELKKSSRMQLPKANLLSTFAIIMRSVMIKIKCSHTEQKRDIIAFYGAPTVVICKVWEIITENTKKEHF